MAEMKGVKSIEYRRAMFNVASAATAFTGTLYADQDNALQNDLGTRGDLPSNAYGNVLGIGLHYVEAPISTSASGLLTWRALVEIHQNLTLTLTVNGVRVVTIPAWACALPTLWMQGATNDVLTVDEYTMYIQNGSYRMDFIPHPVAKRERLQVRIGGTPNGTLPTLANGWDLACYLITEEIRAI